MTTYYKAVRPSGHDFYSGQVDYLSGDVIWHPRTGAVGESNAQWYLSVSVEPADCTGFRWPCRLLEVEPVGDVWSPGNGLPHKRACHALRVVREVEAGRALGPNGEAVAAFIARIPDVTGEQWRKVVAAWVAARDAAWDAARVAARDAARDAARYAAWVAAADAAGYAAGALVVRGLIPTQHYDTLTRPMRLAGIVVHPDDPPLAA